MLIGERPGLTALDSMGLYLTYAPRIGTRDAAAKLLWLTGAALRIGATGVALKDEQPEAQPLLG